MTWHDLVTAFLVGVNLGVAASWVAVALTYRALDRRQEQAELDHDYPNF